MRTHEKQDFVSWMAKIAYGLGCLALYIIAIWIFFGAIWMMIQEALAEDFVIYHLLDEVGLLVFSIAVIDVGKFLMIEEVLKNGYRSPKKERGSFSRFLIIILTALSIEGLVLTIETAKTDLEKIIYPIMLFTIIALLILALGVYQKLNASSD